MRPRSRRAVRGTIFWGECLQGAGSAGGPAPVSAPRDSPCEPLPATPWPWTMPGGMASCAACQTGSGWILRTPGPCSRCSWPARVIAWTMRPGCADELAAGACQPGRLCSRGASPARQELSAVGSIPPSPSRAPGTVRDVYGASRAGVRGSATGATAVPQSARACARPATPCSCKRGPADTGGCTGAGGRRVAACGRSAKSPALQATGTARTTWPPRASATGASITGHALRLGGPAAVQGCVEPAPRNGPPFFDIRQGPRYSDLDRRQAGRGTIAAHKDFRKLMLPAVEQGFRLVEDKG